jgi:two-component system chemotaxis sensor kinase CheA
VVVVRHGSSQAGIAVDTLHGDSQTVIKPLAKVFRGLPGISGSSIMGDGRVALILDVAGLLRETLRRVDVPAA